MELNWKIMHGIQEISGEREFLYSVLQNIEEISGNFSGYEESDDVLNIIGDTPKQPV